MRSKLLVTASVPCAYYFYSSTRSQSCLMEGEESPLHRMQKQIDDSGLPISLTNNFSLNLIAGGAIVMYWGAMWNLLDRYFLVKRIPNPTANSVLRIVVGLGILAYVEISFFFRAHNYTHTHTYNRFQDNDIKEIGDKWDGLEDEEEDDENAEDVVQKSNLGSLVSESVFLASVSRRLSLNKLHTYIHTHTHTREGTVGVEMTRLYQENRLNPSFDLQMRTKTIS